MTNEKKNTKNIIIVVLLLIVVAAGAFYGGTLFQKSKATSERAQFASGNVVRFGQGGPGGDARGTRTLGGAVMGDVVAIDDTSLTVKMMDGSSKIVNLTSSTTFNKSSEGTIKDIDTGTKVAVFGTSNSDGSVTAQNVSINPLMRMGNGTPAVEKK
jgi:hypothetical protein